MEKLKTIQIGNENYPILCDLNVLDTLQNEFGSVHDFELALMGVKYIKDKDGRQIYTEDGEPQIEVVEPSIKAIKIALVEMVNEGIAYKAYCENKSWDMLEDFEILVNCQIPFSELSNILHEEYKRCFETKKSTPRESKRKKTT